MGIKTRIEGLKACLRFDNRLQLILDRLFFRDSRFVPHRLDRIQFVADQMGGDECGLRPCLIDGIYNPFLNEAKAFKRQVPLNVADIGANAGGFSLIFLLQKVDLKKIAAMEMNPLTYSRLRLNLLTNYGPVAKCWNAAVSSDSGRIDVPFTFGGTGDSVGDFKKHNGPSFSVPMVTLDEFLDAEFPGEKIDILKLDVEGAEWNVIDSGKCERFRDVRYLIVEIHARKDRGPAEFKTAMAGYGFSLLDVKNPQEPDVFCFRNDKL